MVCYEAYIGS